jgi:hypothetical protein
MSGAESPVRVLTLLVRYGEASYGDALSRLDAVFHRQAPEVERETIVVDNALPPGHVAQTERGLSVIGGDNSAHEFSGWDRAVSHVGRALDGFDVVHLATSAFGMLYTGYLERFDSGVLRLVADRPIAAGHIDYYPHAVAVGEQVSQHWLRTSFVFLAPREVRGLRTLVSHRSRQALFSGDPRRPFRADGPVSEGCARLIVDWLTSPRGTGQGVAWHSRIDLGTGSLRRFEDKAMAILNEHALSVRLRAQGCAAVDLSYLALATRRGEAPLFWPSWRRQVTDRADASHAFPPAGRFS